LLVELLGYPNPDIAVQGAELLAELLEERGVEELETGFDGRAVSLAASLD
jgi:hypothetical protein